MARRGQGLPLAQLREKVERRARWRCEYCHAPQRVSGYRFHLEHIIPKFHRGADSLSNRALPAQHVILRKRARLRGSIRKPTSKSASLIRASKPGMTFSVG